MHIVLLAQCITEECVRLRDNRRYLSAAGRKKVLNLAAYLNALGHEVTILSNSYAKGRFPATVERLGERITVHHAPTWAIGRTTPLRRGIATLFALRWLARHHRQVDLAISYNYHLEFALPALWARRRHGLPFVLDYEDGLYLVRHYRSPTYRLIERATYRACSAVIAVNPGLRERMLGLGIDRPTVVIHGYFDGGTVAGLAAAPGTHCEVLFAGNFSRGFGFDELLRYIGNCPEGWTLNICGRGGAAETEALRAACERHPRARFLGFVADDELDDLRRRARAVLVLNDTGSDFNRSNFPSKLFDLLSAGKIVVSTANPLLADYAGIGCMLQLESIERDFPRLPQTLPQRQFVAADIVALHERMLERLRSVLQSAMPAATAER